MNTRQTLLLGLTGLGFVLSLPAQAAPSTGLDLSTSAKLLVSDFKDTGFVLAKRDESDLYDARPDPRDEARAKGNKKSQPREAERPPKDQEYGYGYERRQQPPRHDDDRGRH